MLLCVQRGDIENMDPKLVFHFYNLSNEKYYKKYGVLKIYVEKLSLSQKIQKRIEKYQWDKMNHQRKEHLITCSPLFKFSQFFLEKICNKVIESALQEYIPFLKSVNGFDYFITYFL